MAAGEVEAAAGGRRRSSVPECLHLMRSSNRTPLCKYFFHRGSFRFRSFERRTGARMDVAGGGFLTRWVCSYAGSRVVYAVDTRPPQDGATRVGRSNVDDAIGGP